MRIFFVTLLLLIFACLSISSMMQKSGTCDEIAYHIVAGYSYFKTFDFRLNPSNPPLPRYIMAFPLNFMDLKASFNDINWQKADSAKFSRKFFFQDNRDKFRTILFLSRLMVVFCGIFAGFLVYRTASRFYGEKSGLFSLFLFCFTPEIIAHSSLATLDMVFACFTLLAIFSFWRFSTTPALTNILFASVSLGLAQLSKGSALLLYPAFLFLIFIKYIKKQTADKYLFLKTILIFIFSVIVIWAGYGFNVKSFLAQTVNQEEKINFAQKTISKFIPGWDRQKTEHLLKDVKLPLTTYVTTILGVAEHTKEGHNTFIWGKWSQYGSRWYYVVAFLIKTPIPMLILFGFALFSLCRKSLTENELYIVVPAVLIFAAASFSKLQIGIRYILPVYLLICIFISRVRTFKLGFIKRGIIFLLGVWIVTISLFSWSNYLSYFNEFIGGPDNGWRYLRDSNLDWGQDLPALAKYVRKNKINELTFFYFGEDDPSLYGINFKNITAEEIEKPRKAIYAISAQFLDSVNWSRLYKPTTKAGFSIFIYDLR